MFPFHYSNQAVIQRLIVVGVNEGDVKLTKI